MLCHHLLLPSLILNSLVSFEGSPAFKVIFQKAGFLTKLSYHSHLRASYQLFTYELEHLQRIYILVRSPHDALQKVAEIIPCSANNLLASHDVFFFG